MKLKAPGNRTERAEQEHLAELVLHASGPHRKYKYSIMLMMMGMHRSRGNVVPRTLNSCWKGGIAPLILMSVLEGGKLLTKFEVRIACYKQNICNRICRSVGLQ